ncbi:MAG TPA: response regulator, partial [Spirochaetia bacterium]|nr:response regulator [Spirochaetia bacterium]
SMLEVLFSREAYSILTAPDAETGLSLAQSRPIDGAVIDLHLPGMNGHSLLAELKRRRPQAQVCIMTGQGGVQDAVAAIRNGAVDFLEKPLALETLKARVSRMYEIWRL